MLKKRCLDPVVGEADRPRRVLVTCEGRGSGMVTRSDFLHQQCSCLDSSLTVEDFPIFVLNQIPVEGVSDLHARRGAINLPFSDGLVLGRGEEYCSAPDERQAIDARSVT